MFGESDSESPRVGSPWDSLLTPPTSETLKKNAIVPKLIPEVEEGNVEYKLKLVEPSAERFMRLVTQLKWRLLEGGGQAYYELGVADSGQLVGLSRLQLEQSLHTLEEMAGEIGASVIVVKEIEVPPALQSAMSQEQKAPDGALRLPKKPRPGGSTPDSAAEDSTEAEGETETSASDSDTDPLAAAVPRAMAISSFHHRSVPERPSSQSSPGLFAFDSDLETVEGTFELEISSVFKPRPVRKRSTSQLHLGRTRKANRQCNKRDEIQQLCKITSANGLVSPKKKNISKDRRRKEERRPTNETIFPTLCLSPADVVGRALVETELCGSPKDEPVGDDAEERSRFIVEALVVRKMSLEEAFLDFGGFSLER